MLTQTTLEHLRTLKLDGMARGLEEQRQRPTFQDLGFEDRLGMIATGVSPASRMLSTAWCRAE